MVVAELKICYKQMERLTFEDIVADKRLTRGELMKDLANLDKFNGEENTRKFCGNNFIYHFQMANLCRTKVGGRDNLEEIMADDTKYQILYNKAVKLNRTGTLANRMFEAYRFNGACVFFKASTTKYLVKLFKATHMLDPTAGWGGRMLGAWSAYVNYTGIDTNINLKPAYDAMIEQLGVIQTPEMIWGNCLDVDFSTIPYDFVLTSPPYINLEEYEHMPPFESRVKYYTEFLIPLLTKCLAHIKPGGFVCFNISGVMYCELLKHGFRPCDRMVDLLEQKRLSKNRENKIYCWTN
jgi:hypothetical protein